jgi:hypothetical protein
LRSALVSVASVILPAVMPGILIGSQGVRVALARKPPTINPCFANNLILLRG